MDYIELNKSEEGKRMADSVKALYGSVYKVLSVHCKLNVLAMNAAQSLGYNGFKRWHRHNAKCLFEKKMCLMNELFDRFRIVADFKEQEISYSPASLDEHLKAWEKALLDGIQELGTLSKEFFSQTGMRGEIAECTMKMLSHDYEKAGRFIKRFNESDWLTLDMHTVDDQLHEKYKRMEQEGEQWNPWAMNLKTRS